MFPAGRDPPFLQRKAGETEVICLHGDSRLCRFAEVSAPIPDEWRKTLDLFWNLYRREKDFVPFQIGFRSLAADCAKILPI